MRGSSIIRGEQIAEYLGAKLNPESGYENDICIYVKPHTRGLYSGTIQLAKHAVIDIIDGTNLVLYASKNFNIPVIACSRTDYNYLSRRLSNKVTLIPQHHCNFERAKRTRNQIITAGIIGNPESLAYLPDNFEERLAQSGLNLLAYSRFHRRQDVVDFYQKIDIQVVWRPWRKKLSNPLKIVNAGSFGIPTIAYDEDAFEEMDGCYVPVKTLDGFMAQLENLKSSPDLYDSYAEKCLARAEEYHISKVAELYKQLEMS
ncbi:hypothetical protein A2966_03515 [Candidatus Roizmanbacteria bacterium RIFCSPLOWO2_01_FULL_41_22]|uniref:Glycosyl transferase family 1 domain-containing protein n=1 Tax=Candidatus Roizmanbacteria bacterium RIFCSPLOWO2_01_FULL_41_22 TaxID=1802067 RepID=A0A1F7JAF2_9BACT|nr:MAG: hypothetical protein A2966_03515 [Candidatus Roizmanbacteria bacterium RIFCSPLOWO2_01_FULL_41_22]